MTRPIRIGILRLVDSAPVVVAAARGLFDAVGLDVRVTIEPSWANLADKLAFGLLEAAVMLPPLALASAAGLRGPGMDLIVPMGLTQGGNSIVLGEEAALGTGSAPLITWLRAQPAPPRLAVVHRFSTHNLLLRYWLALAGADPDRDIETVVVPPERVVDALAQRQIAGFCAGAPWGDEARRRGVGHVLIGTSSIWPFHPEKCLAVRGGWADAHEADLRSLLRALLRAQMICDAVEEADEVADLLAQSAGLGLPRDPSRGALPGGRGADNIRFHTGEVWFPAHAHAMWFLGQMARWGWMDTAADLTALARRVYRPDLLAPAVHDEGLYAAACVPALEGSALLPMP